MVPELATVAAMVLSSADSDELELGFRLSSEMEALALETLDLDVSVQPARAMLALAATNALPAMNVRRDKLLPISPAFPTAASVSVIRVRAFLILLR